MNVYSNPNGTGTKPYQWLNNPEQAPKSNQDSRELDDLIENRPKPNLNGLIKYFSTNSAQQESAQFSKAMISNVPKKQDESLTHAALLSLQQPTIAETKRSSPIAKKTSPVNSTSPDYTKPVFFRHNKSEQKLASENGTTITSTSNCKICLFLLN